MNKPLTSQLPSQLLHIEQLSRAVKLWEGLEIQKQWYPDFPEALSALDGAILNLRLHILLVVREGTANPTLPAKHQSSRSAENLGTCAPNGPNGGPAKQTELGNLCRAKHHDS